MTKQARLKIRSKALFKDVKPWRASDQQTRIEKLNRHAFTYRQGRVQTPQVPADVYRIDTVVRFASGLGEQGRLYIIGERLDTFLSTWSEHAETVVDVRPMSAAEALAELAAFESKIGGC